MGQREMQVTLAPLDLVVLQGLTELRLAAQLIHLTVENLVSTTPTLAFYQQGSQGFRGFTGAVGPAGPPGPRGNAGINGVDGVQGQKVSVCVCVFVLFVYSIIE